MKYLFLLAAYLLGSIPTGYLIFRLKEKKDIRGFGSQNIGATNVLRVTGWRLALPVAVADILKGAVPVYLSLKLFPEPWVAYGAGLAAIVGHCYPVFIGFRGGKGVATSIGVYSVLALMPLFFIVAVFIGVIALTRYVSLGSLSAAFSFPLLVLILNGEPGTALLGAAVFMLIAFRHRQNIERLIRGTERKLGSKKT
jgi:glycerol-3-phosphate acyltransferase PlsY